MTRRAAKTAIHQTVGNVRILTEDQLCRINFGL